MPKVLLGDVATERKETRAAKQDIPLLVLNT